jgi:elongation factor 1-alpha
MMNEQDGALSLPAEAWLRIFAYSSSKDVAQHLSLVCHYFHDISKDDSLWKIFCLQVGITLNTIDGETSWRKAFITGCHKHIPPHAVWAVLGHVDSGKSTLCGSLLYHTKAVSQEQLDRLDREAQMLGKGSFKYAFVINNLKAERERGITIENHTAFCQFQDYSVALINTPGHRDFVKTTYAGIAEADYGIVVVASVLGEFEAGYAPSGQTREHVLLAKTGGLTKLVFAINKMDYSYRSSNEAEARYNEIVQELLLYSKKVGYSGENVAFVPISAWFGENLLPGVSEKVSSIPISSWYTGPTLWEVMKGFGEPRRPTDQPLRMTISRLNCIPGVGTVAVGRILTGFLRPDDQVVLTPSLKEAEGKGPITVKSIEKNHKPLLRAIPGDLVGVLLTAKGQPISIKRKYQGGVILSHAPSTPRIHKDLNPPQLMKIIKCQVIILNAPKPLRVGFSGVMLCHTAQIPMTIITILTKIDKRAGQEIEAMPKSLGIAEAGIVLMQPRYPFGATKPSQLRNVGAKLPPLNWSDDDPSKGFCVDTYSSFPALGRFAMYASRECTLVGVIKEINVKPPEGLETKK